MIRVEKMGIMNLPIGKLIKLALYVLLTLFLIIFSFAAMITLAPSANAKSRIKDIVSVEGIRDNILVGYGLVVGLNGTGDKLNSSKFTEKSLQAFLDRLGVNTSDTELKAKNVAAVTVTAILPPFSRAGSKIDVRVSTLGDAKSLQGGTLVATPMMGANGEVYSVAQGAVAIGGFEAKGENAGVSKGVPTNGFIANGAIVEKEIAFNLDSMKQVKFALRNPDISTAERISTAINAKMGKNFALVLDPGTVLLNMTLQSESVASVLAKVENIEVEPDQIARVIIDESSGTIVMNENVRVDTVAIAQGNLVVSVSEAPIISQPGVLAPEGAETVEATATTVAVSEESERQLGVVGGGASLGDLVKGLNSLGVGPRDLITILQTIKVAGALQAEIETR